MQDKAKTEVRKLSSPPEPKEIQSMVHYAKNVIEEFRRAKHYKNILFSLERSLWRFPVSSLSASCCLSLLLDSVAHPSELLEMCELSLEKMGAIFADTNIYMLHMMYQAMGVCLYMQDWDGAMSYGEKIVQPYRWADVMRPKPEGPFRGLKRRLRAELVFDSSNTCIPVSLNETIYLSSYIKWALFFPCSTHLSSVI